MGRRSRVPGAISLRDAREGVAAVEFALLAPVLILLFTGAVSLGLASWTKMQVGNAARAGAVYAVNHGYNKANIQAAAQNATALSTKVSVVTSPEATQSCIDPATGTISPAGAAAACPGTGSSPGNYVTITTTMSYSLIMPIPGIAKAMTLSGNAVARIK